MRLFLRPIAARLLKCPPFFGIVIYSSQRYESMALPLEIYISTSMVGVNAGAVDGFSHVNARPQTVGRTKKVISKRDMLISVLSYVSVDGFLSRRNIRSRPSVPVRD